MKTKRFLTVIVLALMLAFCATEPEPLDRTQPEAVNKAMFSGEWIYKATVTDTDWDNKFTFIGEETSSYEGDAFKVRWEITMDYLNAYKIPQRYMTPDGRLVENQVGSKNLILSFRIKKHYDIRYRYNSTTREDLNVIEENYDRPWNEREYMEVDWSQNLATNVSNPLQMDLASGELVREPVSVYENVEFFARGLTKDEDYKIDTRKWNPKTDPEVYTINIDLKESIRSRLESWIQLYYGEYMPPVTVKTRHSLMKALPIEQQTYKPMQYDDYFFRRFGFFRTEYDTYDPERGPMENQKKYLINRWDFSNGKKLVWYASPSFQEQINEGDSDLKGYALKVIEEWNKVLKEALGRTDDVLEFKENEPLCNQGVKVTTDPNGVKVCEDGKQVTNLDGSKRWKYELGDLRYSFLNFITKPQNSSPLGYGPSTPDADTGEIVSATVNVYGNWADYVVRRTMDQFDVASGLCTLDNVKDGYFYNPDTGKCDSPIFIGKYKGGVVPQKAPPAAENSNQSNNLRTLTPALKTAYYPKFDIHKPTPNIPKDQLAQDMQKLKVLYDFQRKNPVSLDMNGFKTIKGTKYEAMMVPQATLNSILPYAKSASDPDVIALLSPANRLDAKFLEAMKRGQLRRMKYCDEPIMFEPAINSFVEEMKGKPRDEVYKVLRNWIWYTTTLHEMGHTLGLRHNFRGSVDERNFSPEYKPAYDEYWNQINALRAKYQARINAGDAEAYEAYVKEVDNIKATHQRYASSSIMDYLGDWDKWQYPVPSYDKAAIVFGYGNKIEVSDGKGGWTFTDYKDGDFRQKDFYDPNEQAESGRVVRYYMFCSDEKVFDDAFCTRFDVGVTMTEIVRNFIRNAEPAYFFKNFKRHSAMFDERRDSYYINKWLWTYYMYAKALGEMTLGSMRYDEMWSSIFDGIDAINKGPETRDMIPGYHRNGGEDLLRATMIYYYYLLYDILMRPDYGYYQLSYDTAQKPYWEFIDKEAYLDDSKVHTVVPAGVGWGWMDKYDQQTDINQYYPHLERIGIELDKIIALEILSIPAALNEPLYFEKANGVNFWNSLWTNNGMQLWEIMRGLITDNFSHHQNPWCIKCDAACKADPVGHPPQIKTYPVDLLEGMRRGGLIGGYVPPSRENRCGGDDEYPMQPGMDALYAIYPIFYAIAGASHPWYHNSLSDYLDSQVVGGTHRFDPPPGAKTVTMVNSSGTKTYLAAQTSDNLSIAYQLVSNGHSINTHLAYFTACFNNEEPSDELKKEISRPCDEVLECYNPFVRPSPDYCEAEGWDILFLYDGFKYRNLDRVEAMLIMMQDMIDIAGHYQWRVPGYLEEP